MKRNRCVLVGEVSPQRRYLRGVLSVSEIAARRGVSRPEVEIAAAPLRAYPHCGEPPATPPNDCGYGGVG